MTVGRMFFYYCNRKLDLMSNRRDGALICKNTAFLCNDI